MEDLFTRIKNKALQKAQEAVSFVQNNPTPAGFINKNVVQPTVQRLQPQIQQIQPSISRQLNTQQQLSRQGLNFAQTSVPARALTTDLAPQIDVLSRVLNRVSPKITPLTDILSRSTGMGVGDMAKAALNFSPIAPYSEPEQAYFRKVNAGDTNFSPEEMATAQSLNEQGIYDIGGMASSVKSLRSVLDGSNAIRLPRRPSTAITVTPEGTAFKVSKQPKSTAGLDAILERVKSVNPKTPRPASPPLLEAPKNMEIVKVEKPSAVPPKPKSVQPIKSEKSSLRKLWEDVTRSSKGVISRSGKSGKQIENLLSLADEEGALAAGKQTNDLFQAFRNLNKQEKITLADAIESGKPVSQNQARVIGIWNQISEDIYKRAKGVGLDIGWIENYFPHYGITDFKNPTAKTILNRSSQRRYGNLEFSRQSDVSYDKDPSILFDYIDRANKRIAEAKYFGKEDKVLYDLAAQSGFEGGDANQVVKYVDQILGKNQVKPLQDISSNIRGFQTIFKLNPKTAVTNLTQNLSTALGTDIPSTLKAIGKTVSNPRKAFSNALKAAEISPEMARVFDDYAGSGKVVSRWLHAIGMLGAEKINRVIAVNAGIEYLTKLSQQASKGNKAAIRELARLGVNSTDDILKGARRISQQTQFSTKPGELPYGWNTALGKILTQFKSFSYKQSGFLKDQAVRVAQEARKGNLKPLINALTVYGVAAPVVGELVNNINAFLYNKEREDTDTPVERYISNILAASSFGLLDSTGGLFGQFGAKGVVGTLAGPTASDVVKLGETISGATSGDPYQQRQALRNVIKTIPFGVGNALSNTFIPNTYVDNLNIGDTNLGVNEGLGEKDKIAYNNIKSSDPLAAQSFKENKQAERDNKPGLLDRILGKQQPLKAPAKGATAAERKEFNTQVRDVLDQGVIPDSTVLKDYIFDNKSASSSLVQERMDVYKALGKALDDENYTDEQKKAIVKASGAKEEAIAYYLTARKDMDVKLQELTPLIESMPPKERIQFLATGRMKLGGQQLVTSEMITYLYDNQLIGENEKELLSNLKFDEGKNKFYTSLKFSKGSKKKLTFAQAKKLYSIPKIKFNSTSTKQTSYSGDKILEDILLKKP